MYKEIYNSERYFTFYAYQVSHGQLLLRSDKRKGYNTNIDVIFFGTSFVQLFTELHGIAIRTINKTSINLYNSLTKFLDYDDNDLFEIACEEEKYYIAASFVRIFENQLESYETGLGVDETNRKNEIASSLPDKHS